MGYSFSDAAEAHSSFSLTGMENSVDALAAKSTTEGNRTQAYSNYERELNSTSSPYLSLAFKSALSSQVTQFLGSAQVFVENPEQDTWDPSNPGDEIHGESWTSGNPNATFTGNSWYSAGSSDQGPFGAHGTCYDDFLINGEGGKAPNLMGSDPNATSGFVPILSETAGNNYTVAAGYSNIATLSEMDVANSSQYFAMTSGDKKTDTAPGQSAGDGFNPTVFNFTSNNWTGNGVEQYVSQNSIDGTSSGGAALSVGSLSGDAYAQREGDEGNTSYDQVELNGHASDWSSVTTEIDSDKSDAFTSSVNSTLSSILVGD